MIYKYEIRKDDNEDVLYLYCDMNFEFSSNLEDKNKSFKKQIIEYINNMKINFKGTKVVLMIGTIAVGMVLLNTGCNNSDNNNIEPKISYVENIYGLDQKEIQETTQKIEINETEKIEINETEIKEKVNEPKEENNNKVTTNESTNKSEINLSQNNSVVENNTSNQNNSTINENNNTQEQQVAKNNQKYVTIYRSNGSIVTMELEQYLIGVVSAEMPASFNIEALKAQAVLARTYALKSIESGKVLTDTVSTQRYMDDNELREYWKNNFNTYYNKIKSAVDSTSNLVLKYNNNYIEALYHSTSNGKTEDAVYVWGNSVPYLKSVDSSYDLSATSYLRTEQKDLTNVLNILGIDWTDNSNLEIISRNESGRITKLRFGDKTYTGVEFRNLLGLRSADFDLEIKDGMLVITTRGYGHGVGMSQYGANGMAKAGYNYEQILNHYYTGVNLVKI